MTKFGMTESTPAGSPIPNIAPAISGRTDSTSPEIESSNNGIAGMFDYKFELPPVTFSTPITDTVLTFAIKGKGKAAPPVTSAATVGANAAPALAGLITEI